MSKEQCPVFDLECGYISSCYRVREERCIESMSKDEEWKDKVPEDATPEEKEAWMAKVLKEERKKKEKMIYQSVGRSYPDD